MGLPKGLIERIVDAGSADAEAYCHGYAGAKSGGYMIQQDPRELAALIAVLNRFAPFHTALAIGIAAGGVERFLVETVDIKQLVVMDDGKHADFKHWKAPGLNGNAVRDRIPVHEYIGSSHGKKAEKYLEDLKFKFNLVGIDGDCSPAGVRADWTLIQPHLAPGAIVWFHDINNRVPGQTGALELWFELRRRHSVLLETRDTDLGIGAIRI